MRPNQITPRKTGSTEAPHGVEIARSSGAWQHPPVHSSIARRTVGVAAFALMLGLCAPSARPPVVAAEDASVPDRLEEMPSANPESVSRVLAKIRKKYGEDALLIYTQLLLNAMRNGSVLASGTRVDGVDGYHGKRYLGFHVETGLIFDSTTRNETARVQMLWQMIMVPTLERLAGLTVPAEGIKVRMQYHHRPYANHRELRSTIHEPGTSEETVFYLLTADVQQVVDKRIPTPELFARAKIVVDGGEREIPVATAAEPLTPGPE